MGVGRMSRRREVDGMRGLGFVTSSGISSASSGAKMCVFCSTRADFLRQLARGRRLAAQTSPSFKA